MNVFECTFFDGKTAIGYRAGLELMPDKWQITLLDIHPEKQVFDWDAAKVESNETTSQRFTFKYGTFPKQTLECSDANLLNALKELYPKSYYFKKETRFLLGLNPGMVVGLVLLFVGSVFGFYYAGLPFIAERLAANFPVDTEISAGESLYENMVANYEIDDSLTLKVNEFAKHIDFHTAYPIKITVVKESTANAFALPGGHVIVFDRMLVKAKTKEEFVALIAHEVAHVHYKHTLKNLFRNLAGYLFISIISSDVNGLATTIADNSRMMLNLSYSRQLEAEADEKALETMKQNRIDLNGAVKLFEMLQEEYHEPEMIKFISSHPLLEERIAKAKQLAKKQAPPSSHVELEKRWVQIKELADLTDVD